MPLLKNPTMFGHPHGYVPETNIFIKSDDALNALASSVAAEKGITLKGGIIATGDQFICDNTKKKWLKATFKADAVSVFSILK